MVCWTFFPTRRERKVPVTEGASFGRQGALQYYISSPDKYIKNLPIVQQRDGNSERLGDHPLQVELGTPPLGSLHGTPILAFITL